MKSTRLRLFVIAAIIAVAFVGCKKKVEEVTPTTYLYNSSNVVFDTNAIKFQTYAAPSGPSWRNICDSDSLCVFSGGTQIVYYDSSFMNNSFNYATGQATFKVKELYNNSDWIFSNMQTVDNNKRFVQSFGAVYFAVAGQFGDTLDVMADTATVNLWQDHRRATIRVRIPQKDTYQDFNNHCIYAPLSMKVYRNDIDSSNIAPILLTYPDYNWWKETAYPFVYLPTNHPYYYNFQITDSLLFYHWYNLGDTASSAHPLYHGQGTTTLTFQNATSDSYKDVQIFLVLDKPWNTTVIKAVKSSINSTQYIIPNVPLNVTGKIVAWCVSSGKQLYSTYNSPSADNWMSVGPITITHNTATILYKQINIDDLTKAIKKLDN